MKRLYLTFALLTTVAVGVVLAIPPVDVNQDGLVDQSDLDLIVDEYTTTREADELVDSVATWDEQAGKLLSPIVDDFEREQLGDWDFRTPSQHEPKLTSKRKFSGSRSLLLSGAGRADSAVLHSQLELEDVQVSATMFLDSLAHRKLFARAAGGKEYRLTIRRNLNVWLSYWDGESEKVLGWLKSKDYFSWKWAKATLWVNGDNLRAKVFDPTTGRYLDSSGAWTNENVFCLNVVDDQLTGKGRVGFGLLRSHEFPCLFDDVIIDSVEGDTSRPEVAIVEPEGSELSDVVNVVATATDPQGVKEVRFLVDGVTRLVDTKPPYEWQFDTTSVSNGDHELTIQAEDVNENETTLSKTFTSANDNIVTRPEIVTRLPHIKICALKYSAAPQLDATEARYAREFVSVVVSNLNHAPALAEAAPGLQQCVYDNYTNIYLGLLEAWIAWCEKNGVDREEAYYHVSRPFNYTEQSNSTVPVDKFWEVFHDGKEVTSAAWYDKGEIRLSSSAPTITIRDIDMFNVINVDVSDSRQAGTIELTYEDGKSLNILEDSTQGLMQTGTLRFEIPSDWKPTPDGMYSVTINSVGHDATIRSIRGDDFMQMDGLKGIVPAFDIEADKDGNRALDEQEWPNRRPGFNARFYHQSRLPLYGRRRYTVRPSLAVTDFFIERTVNQLDSKPLYIGVFADNSNGFLRAAGFFSAWESDDAHLIETATMLGKIAAAIAPRHLMLNTGGDARSNPLIARVPYSFDEFAIRSKEHKFGQFRALSNSILGRVKLTSPPPMQIIDSDPKGGQKVPTDEHKLSTLAYYYLIAQPGTMINFFGGHDPAAYWPDHIPEAVKFDVGKPVGNWSVLATTPSGTVVQREYDNALVLWKSMPDSGAKEVTTHALDGEYQNILPDGSEGDRVSEVQLESGEGAILGKLQ